MILKTFRYCAKYQLERMNDLDRYTSVVVLDEIGLAEASTSMPLKTLHPLLEEGNSVFLIKKTSIANKIRSRWALFHKNLNICQVYKIL